MKKEWFIFKGTHHQGPYTVMEMAKFFETGALLEKSLVWKEGNAKWESLSKTPELWDEVNKILLKSKRAAPPSFPPLPDDLDDEVPEIPGLPKLPKAQRPQEVTKTHHPANHLADEPPPIPLDALLSSPGQKVTLRAREKRGKNNFSLWLMIVVSIVFVGVLGWYVTNEKQSNIRLKVKGIMPVYLERLQENAEIKAPQPSVAYALSLDGKTIYASINKSGEIRSEFTMRSVDQRAFGSENVTIKVRGIINDHLGQFNKMQLIEGKQFIPGEYDIEFTGRKIHFLNYNFTFLRKIEFFENLNTTYKAQTRALIYAGTPREYEKKILDYQQKVVDERLRPLMDVRERMQTLMSLLNKTTEEYLFVLDSLKKPSDIKDFEKKYIRDISPILQSLVLSANSSLKDTEYVSNKILRNAAQSILSIGKRMGELGADMITEIEIQKSVSKKEVDTLRSKNQSRYSKIKSDLDVALKELDSEIAKLETN